jgi:hypothetical protein
MQNIQKIEQTAATYNLHAYGWLILISSFEYFSFENKNSVVG